MSQFYEKLTTTIPELEIRLDEPMSRHTTFRIGGPADYFVCPDREQIAEVFCGKDGLYLHRRNDSLLELVRAVSNCM